MVLVRELEPDLVVLNGTDAYRRIHGFSGASILMLTAWAEEVDKIVGLSTGTDDYLTKPVSPGRAWVVGSARTLGGGGLPRTLARSPASSRTGTSSSM